MEYPKVSVITPVFNGVQTIQECIESVASQGYPNIEHLVVDGVSTDGTLKLLDKLGVEYISEPDAGIYDAFNKGIERASGDIVNILNSDDMYASASVISDVVDHMQAKKLDLCHAQIEQVDEYGKQLNKVGEDLTKKTLLNKMRVAHPSVFVRRSVYEDFGKFSVGFRIAADYEFMLRVWERIKIGFVPRVMVKMRWGGASNSQVVSSLKESMAASIMHGQSPFKALMIYYLELAKNVHRIFK